MVTWCFVSSVTSEVYSNTVIPIFGNFQLTGLARSSSWIQKFGLTTGDPPITQEWLNDCIWGQKGGIALAFQTIKTSTSAFGPCWQYKHIIAVIKQQTSIMDCWTRWNTTVRLELIIESLAGFKDTCSHSLHLTSPQPTRILPTPHSTPQKKIAQTSKNIQNPKIILSIFMWMVPQRWTGGATPGTPRCDHRAAAAGGRD